VGIKKKIEAHGWRRPSSVELFAPPKVGPVQSISLCTEIVNLFSSKNIKD